MCSFCSEIIEIDKQRAISHWDRNNAIVKWFDKEGKINFGFWQKLMMIIIAELREKLDTVQNVGEN